MPIRTTCTRGRVVTRRALPSLLTSTMAPESTTPKLAPVMPMSADRKASRSLARAILASFSGSEVYGTLIFSCMILPMLSLVMWMMGRMMCDGVVLRQLHDVFAQIRFQHLHARLEQIVVEMRLLRGHGLGLDRALAAPRPGDVHHDRVGRLAVFGPMHLDAVGDEVLLEGLQVAGQIAQQAQLGAARHVPDHVRVFQRGQGCGTARAQAIGGAAQGGFELIVPQGRFHAVQEAGAVSCVR